MVLECALFWNEFGFGWCVVEGMWVIDGCGWLWGVGGCGVCVVGGVWVVTGV